MAKSTNREAGFDTAAAVTRSLLGWGVVAGVFYLVVGLAQALTRDRFDLTEHPLSLLMLGDFGWIQRTNLILSGLMVIAAAVGFARSLRGFGAGKAAGTLVGVFGLALILSGIFAPDPMAGFPPGAEATEGSLSGLLHLAFGAIGFVCLAVAAFRLAGWLDRRSRRLASYSRATGAVILLGFAGGAALATSPWGVLLLWIAVVTGWAWLAVASVQLYGSVPHPDAHRREAGAASAAEGRTA